MEKTIFLACCFLITSCSTTSPTLLVPVKVYEQPNVESSNWPIIWTENALKRTSIITKIDGKAFGSRPYAIVVPPGGYKISVYSYTHVDMPNIQSTPYYEFDVQVNVEQGHNYVIRHDTSGGGRATQPFIEDMGDGQFCEYITGIRERIITLECTKAATDGGT